MIHPTAHTETVPSSVRRQWHHIWYATAHIGLRTLTSLQLVQWGEAILVERDIRVWNSKR
jgi:hypothetical protein